MIRTRILIVEPEHWEQVARAHGGLFGQSRPANALVVNALIGPDYLVEIEADALIGNDQL